MTTFIMGGTYILMYTDLGFLVKMLLIIPWCKHICCLLHSVNKKVMSS